MSLGLLRRLCKRLGTRDGFRMYASIKTNNFNNIQLSGLKHPFTLRDKSDLLVFYEIFVEKNYRVPHKISPTRIIDCGGNIGLASIWFANLYPDAAIVSLEPEQNNFALLQKNTALYKNITLMNNGVWNEPCYLKINNRGDFAMEIEVEKTEDPAEAICTAVTIPQVMATQSWAQIDLIKIDIEGSEKALFSSNYEDWVPKTKLIIIELHENHIKNSSQPLIQVISKYNFRMFTISYMVHFLNNDLD